MGKPPSPQSYRHVVVLPAGAPLFAPATPDLFLIAHTGDGLDGALPNLHVTDLVIEADLPLAWVALEAAYRISTATFAFMQRLGVSSAPAPIRLPPLQPSTFASFDLKCPFYANAPAVPQDELVLLSFDASAATVTVTPVDRVNVLERAMRDTADVQNLRIAARCIGSLFWHIHM